MREFRAEQRDMRLTAALAAALTGGGRSYSSIIEAVEHTHAQIVRHVAAGGGALTEQQEKLLTVVLDIKGAATRWWLAGTYSVADVEAQIEIGCQLLELPDGVVDAGARAGSAGRGDHAGELGLTSRPRRAARSAGRAARPARRTGRAARWRSCGTGARRAPR